MRICYLDSNVLGHLQRPPDWLPPGGARHAARWGQAFKDAMVTHYNHTNVISTHGSSMPTRGNYLDLDPTYKDAWELPLLRMTFDIPTNDLQMSKYVTDRLAEIGKAIRAKTSRSITARDPSTPPSTRPPTMSAAR